jgi:hypothetical protein
MLHPSCTRALLRQSSIRWARHCIAFTKKLKRYPSFLLSHFLFSSPFSQYPFIKIGLRYEDLINSSDPVVSEALSLADMDIVQGRMRRLKRASDLSYKAKNLADYAPNMTLEPFKMELLDDMQKLQARNEEYALLDMYKK